MENLGSFESWVERMFDVVVGRVPSIVVGVLILFIGRYVIRFSLKLINRRFEKRNVSRSVRSFLMDIIRFALYCFLILTAANTMGIQTTSFIAALSAFGLAVGLALQGSLSNFAGGVLILIFRPFDVGDYIDSNNGSVGTVENIDLLYTTLTNDDGIKVYSPNGTLANSVIRNYTKISTRRLQFKMHISFSVNVQEVRAKILNIMTADERLLKNPAPVVLVEDLTDNGMELIVRAWAKREVFWATKEDLAEQLKVVVEDKSISFPNSTVEVISS